MNDADQNPSRRDPREVLSRASLNLSRDHVRSTTKRATTSALASTTSASPIANGAVSFLRIKSDLHQQLLTDLDQRNLISASEEQLTEVVEDFVAQRAAGRGAAAERSRASADGRRSAGRDDRRRPAGTAAGRSGCDGCAGEWSIQGVHRTIWSTGKDRDPFSRCRAPGSHYSADCGSSWTTNRRILAYGGLRVCRMEAE